MDPSTRTIQNLIPQNGQKHSKNAINDELLSVFEALSSTPLNPSISLTNCPVILDKFGYTLAWLTTSNERNSFFSWMSSYMRKIRMIH